MSCRINLLGWNPTEVTRHYHLKLIRSRAIEWRQVNYCGYSKFNKKCMIFYNPSSSGSLEQQCRSKFATYLGRLTTDIQEYCFLCQTKEIWYERTNNKVRGPRTPGPLAPRRLWNPNLRHRSQNIKSLWHLVRLLRLEIGVSYDQ